MFDPAFFDPTFFMTPQLAPAPAPAPPPESAPNDGPLLPPIDPNGPYISHGTIHLGRPPKH